MILQAQEQTTLNLLGEPKPLKIYLISVSSPETLCMACEDKTSPEIRPNLLEIVVLYPKVPHFLGHRWGFYGGLA